VRLHTSEYADWHRMLDAMQVKVDRVVHPESDIVARIMRVLALPGVSDIRDFANGRVKVFSMNITRRSELAGQELQALARLEGAERQKVCLIFRNTQAIVPGSEEKLQPGDHIYVVTASADLEAALAFMHVPRRERVHEVFIVGGGEIGLELARALETEKIAIKLFERDLRRCNYLAEQLTDTVVIRADGTDQETLLRENIEGADAFITLTADDDDNLIACLLARQLGVDKVVPMLNRVNYLPLAQRLGINTSVSRHVKAADALFEFIRKGGVLSVRTLGEEQAEAIELEVPPESSYVGKPLARIGFPIGTQVGAIVRPDGVVVVPNDTFVLHARDRAVLFAQEQAVQRLESTVLEGTRSSRWLL
jgi:trk system potassium uptake protein TrkA